MTKSLRSLFTSLYVPYLLTALIMLCFQLAGSLFFDWLDLKKQGVEVWQAWRWISAHFMHLGWVHLGLNVAGLALASYILAPYCLWREWLIYLMAASLFISGYLILFDGDIGFSYVGFSGILHGLFIVAADRSLFLGVGRRIILALIIISKVLYEQFSHLSAVSTEALIGGMVAVDAHFAGVVFSLLYVCGRRFVLKANLKC